LKTDSGTLRLTNSTNSYSGWTQINGGTLVVTANNALGTVLNNGTIVLPGGTLAFDGTFNYTTPEAITLNGAGVFGAGALNSLTGDVTSSGSTPLASAAPTGSSTAGKTLTLPADLSANYALTVTGAGNTTLNGVLSGSTGFVAGLIESHLLGSFDEFT